MKYSPLSLVCAVSVLLSCLLISSFAQDIDGLNRRILEDTLRSSFLRDSAKNIEEVESAMDKVNSLWPNILMKVINGETSVMGNLSEECKEAVNETISGGFNSTAVLKIIEMVDATGKVPAGLFQGNNYADGAYDECFSMEDTAYCTGFVNLTAIKLPGTSSELSYKFGMCIPKGCNGTDVSLVVNATGFLASNQAITECRDTKMPSYDTGAVIMILVCCFFVILTIVGSLFHCMYILHTEGLQHFVGEPQERPPLSIRAEDCKDDKFSESVLLKSNANKKVKKFKLFEFVEAFSLFKNVPTVMSTKQPPSAITCLNGLRVISMFWVILGHTHLWVLFSTGADNALHLKDVLSRFSFQAVGNAYFAVDSFFFLSGLLVAYLTLRQMARKKGRFPFIVYYIHRYLRLTPAYAFAVFFFWLLSTHLADGPSYFQLTYTQAQQCAKYWWTNLLYISNIYPWKLADQCIAWSWYLANDMQFFVITPLILIPMYHLLPLGLIIASLFLLVCFVVTSVLTGVYDFQANTFAFAAYDYQTNVTVEYNDVLYSKPWHRIAPYLVGLVLGYMLYRRIKLPFRRGVNSIFYLIMWLIAAGILMSCLYGLYLTWHGHTPSLFENVVYTTFTRFAWGIGLALIVFACHNGYGWIINSFLSMKFWIPLSRMTYNAYLFHPLVVSVVIGSERKAIHYGDINMAAYAIACVVLSFGTAALVTVFVEFPLGNIEQVVFKMAGLGGRESARHMTTVPPNAREEASVNTDHPVVSTNTNKT